MLKICVWTFLFFSVIDKGRANISPRSTDMHCNDLCSDVDSYIPTISGTWPTCERGCRFFNIIFLTDGHNISETKKGCHLSCREAYSLGEFKECAAGCDATLEHMAQYKGKGSAAVVMLDFEIVESEIFVDPQIPGNNIRYKFPGGKLGKVPIEAFLDEEFLRQDGDSEGHLSWINCITKQAKASKLIVFHVFILLIIIVFLWTVNILNGPALSNDQPVLGHEKKYYDPDLDMDIEESLNEKEEVKVIRHFKSELLEGNKNPKA